MRYVAEIVYLMRDLLLAFIHVLIARRRVAYATRTDVRAPRETVWRLIDSDDVTFEDAALVIRLSPIPGVPEGYAAETIVRGHTMPALAYQKLKVVPCELHVSRYLPEHSEAGNQIGDDDIITILLKDGPTGPETTRLAFTRELTHRTFATRIMAPLGIRQAAWLIERQAERDAGVEAPKRSAANHALVSLAAFLSFAWIAGWADALILMAVIAVHEGGHALAMLWYRLGVSFVGFVPFLGGIAAPARSYDNDWQHGIVALMGVGASLPVVLALDQMAHVNGSATLAKAAVLFAIINGVNLLPLPGLDGGTVTRLLSHRIHPAFAMIVMWGMMAAYVALALYLGSIWIWIAVAFGFLQLIVLSSADDSRARKPLSWGGAAALLVLYVGLLAAYFALSVRTLEQERNAERAEATIPACLHARPA